MTREEQILEAAENFAGVNYDIETETDSFYHYLQMEAFNAGAEWADEHPQNSQLSVTDRGIIDEIIFALNSLSKEKMISYHKEIEFLNKIRKL